MYSIHPPCNRTTPDEKQLLFVGQFIPHSASLSSRADSSSSLSSGWPDDTASRTQQSIWARSTIRFAFFKMDWAGLILWVATLQEACSSTLFKIPSIWALSFVYT